MKENDRRKSLESLEKEIWGPPSYDSYLVTTCHSLRSKSIGQFEVEDLRIMIGQNIGTKYLMPLALEVLQENILAEGDFFPGDLFKNVTRVETEYWKCNPKELQTLKDIIHSNKNDLKAFIEDYSKILKIEIDERTYKKRAKKNRTRKRH